MKEYYILIALTMFFGLLAQSFLNLKVENQTNSLGIKNVNKVGYYYFSWLTVAMLTLFAGLRYRVGADYGNYIAAYFRRKDLWNAPLIYFDEPGIDWLVKISTMIYDDYAVMFFIASLITIVLYGRTIIKYTSESFLFSILLFIFIGTFAGSFGAMKQYLAAAIIFAGHRYMFTRNFWKYLFVVLLASCFHRTALSMLLVYFIADKKINIKSITILVVATLIFRESYDWFFDLMSSFKETDLTKYTYMNTEVNKFRILVALAPVTLYLLTFKKNKDDKEYRFYSMLMFVNAAFLLATANSAYLARIGIFTETFTVFAFPVMLKNESSKVQKICSYGILLCYCLYFIYQIRTVGSLSHFDWIWHR